MTLFRFHAFKIPVFVAVTTAVALTLHCKRQSPISHPPDSAVYLYYRHRPIPTPPNLSGLIFYATPTHTDIREPLIRRLPEATRFLAPRVEIPSPDTLIDLDIQALAQKLRESSIPPPTPDPAVVTMDWILVIDDTTSATLPTAVPLIRDLARALPSGAVVLSASIYATGALDTLWPTVDWIIIRTDSPAHIPGAIDRWDPRRERIAFALDATADGAAPGVTWEDYRRAAQSIAAARSKGPRDLIWFEFPLSDSPPALPLKTLRALLEGRDPRFEVRGEVRFPDEATVEIWVRNTGEYPPEGLGRLTLFRNGHRLTAPQFHNGFRAGDNGAELIGPLPPVGRRLLAVTYAFMPAADTEDFTPPKTSLVRRLEP